MVSLLSQKSINFQKWIAFFLMKVFKNLCHEFLVDFYDIFLDKLLYE